MNTLNLLYAQLDLRFGLLREGTANRLVYSYKPSAQFIDYVNSNPDPISKIILASSIGRTTKYVDVYSVGAIAMVKREDVVRKLQGWSERGIIELEPPKFINLYRMIKPFPRNKEDIQRLIDDVYEQMKARQADNRRRYSQVIQLITSPKCFALSLAAHFGDEASVGAGCGKCQFCLTGEIVRIADSAI